LDIEILFFLIQEFAELRELLQKVIKLE